jgi:hypothetical protein
MNMPTSSLGSLAIAALIALLLNGCGGSPTATRYQLSGKVSYGGQPVPAGTIVFEPEGVDVTADNMGQAEIRDGQYKTLPKMGVSGGPQKVYINGTDGVALEESPLGSPIFSTYSTRIDLPKADSTHDFDVPSLKRGGK